MTADSLRAVETEASEVQVLDYLLNKIADETDLMTADYTNAIDDGDMVAMGSASARLETISGLIEEATAALP